MGGKSPTHSRTAAKRRKRPAVSPSDINMEAAGLLHDMAALQGNARSQLGYKRAAKAIIALPVPVNDLVEAGTLRDVPFIGPSSTRIVTELVATGTSATVEHAVSASPLAGAVAKAREMRNRFLSQVAMGQVLASDQHASIVSKGTFRGDFQMHSTWSDGAESIEVMARACMDLGHSCMGVTDHSYGLPVARGMSMSAVSRQHDEIDHLNDELEGRFRIFKGIEANILADGSLDLKPDERARFEFVVASPHSQLRQAHDQTSRMLAAVRQSGVAILGHPRGRVYNTRVGVVADWRRVFVEAAMRGIAIEIDGNWHRQDIDYVLAEQALDAGCLFALDSDAHSIGELRFTDYSIAHARLAGIPADRVINCWSDDQLSAWMGERLKSGGA
jgi:histidinol phosphatase-like PHP family hydrolase